MLLSKSNGIRYAEHEIDPAASSHPGKLGRLLLKFRSPWHMDDPVRRPRRSIDRELQERWPVDLP
jgi:hypothetical protein